MMAAISIATLVLLSSLHAATFPATFEPRRMAAEEAWFYTGTTPAGPIGDFNGDGIDDWLYQPVIDSYADPITPATDIDARIILGQREPYARPFRFDQ